MIQTRYRFHERRWWMIKDGNWTRNDARFDLERQVRAIAENTQAVGLTRKEIQFEIGKMYVVDRIIARLAARLHAWNGLPARNAPMS